MGIVIKGLKHKKCRFYFITDGYRLKVGTEDELANLLIKFVRMSEKKDRQKAIESIKSVMKSWALKVSETTYRKSVQDSGLFL